MKKVLLVIIRMIVSYPLLLLLILWTENKSFKEATKFDYISVLALVLVIFPIVYYIYYRKRDKNNL